MKKIYLLIAASLLLMLVVACAPADRADAEKTTEDVKDTTDVKDVEKQTVEEKVVETKPKTTEPTKETTETTTTEKTETKTVVKEFPAQVKEIIDRADTKLVSMGYLYAGPENDGRFLDSYYVKGDKVKVKLYEDNIYVTEGYFDTVYLNIVEKTATARCENRKRCISGNTDNMNKELDANYDDFRRKLPYEWLQDITTPTVVGEEVVDKRSVLKIEYPKKDTMVEMWLDKTYGVPLQIKTIYPNEDEELFQFANVQFNTLKEEEMIPPPIEEPRIVQTH